MCAKNFLSLLSIGFFLQVAITLAHNSPEDFVAAHNAARMEVRVAPLTWNDTVAAYAQDYANLRSQDCELKHSKGPYGENIAMGYGDEFNAEQAVKLWVDEKSSYDYASNSCFGDQCLHYTQVVWRNTAQIGCATSQCKIGWTFIVCSYYPPGNYVGELPY